MLGAVVLAVAIATDELLVTSRSASWGFGLNPVTGRASYESKP
jgi:hypothetical protein